MSADTHGYGKDFSAFAIKKCGCLTKFNESEQVDEIQKCKRCRQLEWLAERAYSIRHPSVKWTKAEAERSWAAWDKEYQKVCRYVRN